MKSTSPLLQVDSLTVNFHTPRGVVEAVKGVSFELGQGETMAIVGESGSGKSVTALSLCRLVPEPPADLAAGKVLLNGEDLLQVNDKKLRAVRGGKIAYIFQEPSSSLNPVYSIRWQIAEMLKLHRPDVKNVDAEAEMWLDRVGIVDPGKRLKDYPHQLSGGMQQRVMIAMALCARPDILVADEPTTALDVTIQAQIMELLRQLREELNMAIILITHNFGIVQGFADRVLVMYQGQVVEHGETGQVLRDPQHAYTKALINCIPRLGHRRNRLMTLVESMSEANA